MLDSERMVDSGNNEFVRTQYLLLWNYDYSINLCVRFCYIQIHNSILIYRNFNILFRMFKGETSDYPCQMLKCKMTMRCLLRTSHLIELCVYCSLYHTNESGLLVPKRGLTTIHFMRWFHSLKIDTHVHSLHMTFKIHNMMWYCPTTYIIFFSFSSCFFYISVACCIASQGASSCWGRMVNIDAASCDQSKHVTWSVSTSQVHGVIETGFWN